MFRQILVHPDDQDLQRILLNSGEPGSPIDFRLQTVTYGTACAPFLAIRTLRELAFLERDNLPLGAASLDDDSYVDDILSGADTLPDALRRRDELRTPRKGKIRARQVDSKSSITSPAWNYGSRRFVYSASTFWTTRQDARRDVEPRER
jgi:hypothetical protein